MKSYHLNNREFYEPLFPKAFTYERCEAGKLLTFRDKDICWHLSHIPAAHALDEISTETVFGPLMGFCTSFNALLSPILDEDIYESLLQAWTDYLQGGYTAIHNVDGVNEPLMIPVQLVATSQMHFHKAVFDYVDELDEVKELITPRFYADQAVIRYGDQYIRGICCHFTMPLGTMDLQMSNAGLLFQTVDFNDIAMPLYIPEQSYETAEEAIVDLRDPEKLELGKVFQLLFGALENSEEIIEDLPIIPLVEEI